MTNQSLKDKLGEDIILAMRTKNKAAKGVLTILKSNLQNEEITLKRPLTKDDELTILNRERKQTNDSIEAYQAADRTDLVEKEQAKLAIIESYLPKQLCGQEIQDILEGMNLTLDDNAGKIIGQITRDYKGQVDGKQVSRVVTCHFNALKNQANQQSN